ncbi:MAG: hypothetical protein ACRCTZ_23505 [Sarcina sp.]
MLNNPKKFILASFLTFLITYIFPANSTNSYVSNYGFPVEFLSIPSNISWESLMQSMNLNLLGLTLNIAICYFLITLITNRLDKLKAKK